MYGFKSVSFHIVRNDKYLPTKRKIHEGLVCGKRLVCVCNAVKMVGVRSKGSPSL